MKRVTGLLGAILVFAASCTQRHPGTAPAPEQDNAATAAVAENKPAVQGEQGRTVAEVTTEWKALGANNKLVASAYEDPGVEGVSCFLSRAQTGGLSGTFGVAEDPSDASIACRQTGPVRFRTAIAGGPEGETVFTERLSPLFKGLTVSRHYDAPSNSLVYLTRSTKIINGSPKNSISAVTPQTWEGVKPEAVRLK